MLNKFIFLHHATLNNPSRETISAGLGPAEQYFVVLLVLIFVGIIVYFRKKKKKRNK